MKFLGYHIVVFSDRWQNGGCAKCITVFVDPNLTYRHRLMTVRVICVEHQGLALIYHVVVISENILPLKGVHV